MLKILLIVFVLLLTVTGCASSPQQNQEPISFPSATNINQNSSLQVDIVNESTQSVAVNAESVVTSESSSVKKVVENLVKLILVDPVDHAAAKQYLSPDLQSDFDEDEKFFEKTLHTSDQPLLVDIGEPELVAPADEADDRTLYQVRVVGDYDQVFRMWNMKLENLDSQWRIIEISYLSE